MRIKLTIAYDGTDFYGSQIQNQTDKTVIGTLHKALQKVGISSIPIASGRTDRGVHATAQVCHLDLPDFWSDCSTLMPKLNRILPSSLQIKRIERVADDFHARYNAKSRVYRYILSTDTPSPFTSRYVTYMQNIDIEVLQKKILLFEGIHDFSSFCKTGSDVHTYVREIYRAFVYKHKNYIILHFEANGFLRAQIRMMVAALLECDVTTIKAMLAHTSSKRIKPAPSNGLYLAKIKYERSHNARKC